MQILLPKISDRHCYNQLLEAIDNVLLNKVRSQINEDMDWNEIIRLCEIHDSILHEFRSGVPSNKTKNGQKLRPQQFTPGPSHTQPAPSTQYNKRRFTKRPPGPTRTFKKLTDKERAKLTKSGSCFYSRKPGHQAQNCTNKKQQIRSVASTIQREQQIVHTGKITSAAQSLKLQLAEIPAPSTKGKAVQPILDSAKEHILVTTELNGHPAKTLIDQQTAGADLISSKLCALHNLPLYDLRPPITLQMTMKGSQGSISHYT